MDTLQIAYKILYGLEHKDSADTIGSQIGPEKLGVPGDKWYEVLQTLIDEGYVSGIRAYKDILGNQTVEMDKARITMKGAEYLHENSTMKKFAKAASDVITIIKP